MKRILIFSMTYDPFIGGAEVAIKEITNRILEKDIEFHMVTAQFDRGLPRKEKVGNVLVHRVGIGVTFNSVEDTHRWALYPLKILFVPFAVFKALRLQKYYKYDEFWAMMTYMLFPIVLMRFLGIKVPYILSLQEGDPFEHMFGRLRILPFKWILLQGFKKADRMQTISTYLAQWGTAMGFHGKPVVIPNGVDIQVFSKEYPRRELETLKQKLEKKVNSVFLITTSRLVRKNGIDSVIKALPFLPEHVSFLVIGGGPEEVSLKKLALEEGVMSRVKFLGEIPNKELPRYLKVSDIFIRPSRSEGMGISFVEAMAAGIPMITTQVGGITDFLFDPEKNPDVKPTGLAVDVDDPEGIAKAVLRYSSDVLLRREVVDNAFALVKARYDWKIIVPAMRNKFFKLDSKVVAKQKK